VDRTQLSLGSSLALLDHLGEPTQVVVRLEPPLAMIGSTIRVDFECLEALELLGMTLAHLNDAENRAELSPRVPLLMAIRDKLALALREES